jgi:hypothetical protein
MARSLQADSTAPTQSPEIAPSHREAVGSAWLMESVMQMQQSVGELRATANYLKSASDKQGAKLDRISHIIFASGVVLAMVLALGGFILNKIWDGVFTLLKTLH